MNFSLQKTHIVGVAIFAAVLIVGLWTFVQAEGTEISMCVKQSGASYVIGTGFANQSCKSNEQLLTFNVTGPQGPQGIQGPIGPQGSAGPGIALYDANNEVAAYVLDYSTPDYFTVFDPELKVILIAEGTSGASTDSSPGNPSELAYFLSNDCTGIPYLAVGNLGSIPIQVNSRVWRGIFASGGAIRDYSLPILTNPAFLTRGYPTETGCETVSVHQQGLEFGVPMKPTAGLFYSDRHPGPFHFGTPTE